MRRAKYFIKKRLPKNRQALMLCHQHKQKIEDDVKKTDATDKGQHWQEHHLDRSPIGSPNFPKSRSGSAGIPTTQTSAWQVTHICQGSAVVDVGDFVLFPSHITFSPIGDRQQNDLARTHGTPESHAYTPPLHKDSGCGSDSPWADLQVTGYPLPA